MIHKRHTLKAGLLWLFLLAAFQVNASAKLDAPNSARDVCPIKIGENIPNLTLRDMQGKPFDLAQAMAKKPTILIFYRGGWCPYCNVHLGELKTIEPTLQQLGYQIIAISPDAPSDLKSSAKKQTLTYRLLSDSNADAAKALGLAFRVKGGADRLLPVPAALVVDKKGKVSFSFVSPDFKVRVDSQVLLAAAKSAVR